jgi:hypothetical protein
MGWKPSTRPSNGATVDKLYLDSHLGSSRCLDKRRKTRIRQIFLNLQETDGQDKPYGSITMWKNCTRSRSRPFGVINWPPCPLHGGGGGGRPWILAPAEIRRCGGLWPYGDAVGGLFNVDLHNSVELHPAKRRGGAPAGENRALVMAKYGGVICVVTLLKALSKKSLSSRSGCSEGNPRSF